MTTTETIIYLFGTGVGGALLGKSYDKFINKRKDELDIELKEQVFYKNLISDMKAQRDVEHLEMQGLKNHIDLLTSKIEKLVTSHKEKEDIIEGLKRSNARWEDTCRRLEYVANQKDKALNKLLNKG